MRVLPLVPLALLLASCAFIGDPLDVFDGSPSSYPSRAQKEAAAAAEAITFTCEDGYDFKAKFIGNMAEVTLPGGTKVMMQQVASGSGTAYRANQYELHTKANEAIFAIGRVPPKRCAQKAAPAALPAPAAPTMPAEAPIPPEATPPNEPLPPAEPTPPKPGSDPQ